MKENSPQNTSFFASRAAWVTSLLVIVILGFAIRLYDLTDLPLDFHPTRQLVSVLKARGIYYQTLSVDDVPAEERSFAIQQWRFRSSIEPEVLDNIVAFTYRFTGEQAWVARIYSSLFWMIGAVFLFLLARELTSIDGALAATAFYVFLPYAVIASRSFQPDPLMVMLTIIFLWAVYKWSNTISTAKTAKDANSSKDLNLRDLRALSGSPMGWLFAILAGLFGGFAIFIKFVAAFFVIGGGLGATLGRGSFRETLKQPQIYVMTLLGILPGTAYLIYGVWIAGYLGSKFSSHFIPSLLLNPSYYLGWIATLNHVIGGVTLMLALLGLFFLENEKLRFMLGLWAAYALFGLYFNYHIFSHDYYSLPLIPIVALSLAPLAHWFFAQMTQLTTTHWSRFTIYCLLLFGIFASLWNSRTELNSIDYRPDAAMWAEISEKIGDSKAAGLTQDYGSRLAYWGWQNITSWPTYGDLIYHDDLRGAQRDFEKQFENIVLTKELFLVTDFDDLARQPFLKEKLSTYLIFAEGDGYVIYNLR
ncbi:MAG: glycosyltransferase family 39 protein [Anaerolineales bacterium]|nr:glycosyltransferase family 39 protein [Anaerolineales bacterium]